MTKIPASQIKELREKTSAGMLDCRKALNETAGDLEAAVDWLRKNGLSAAAKKSGRVAAEGVVAVASKGNKAAIIELNAETDFVARNEQFQALAKKSAELALEQGNDIEKLQAAVADDITNAIATIGENMNLRRCATLSVDKGVVATYIHNAVVPGMGKIAIMLGVETEGDAAKAEAFGKQVAMHIAATRPDALNKEDVSEANLERERAVYSDQAKASGKPDNIIEKMVEGRIRKYYEEVVLMEQVFVVDGKAKVSEAVAEAAKDIGAPVKLTEFICFQLGEGVEKEEADFAAEVAAAANG